jgi:hypothetical protein
LLKFVAAVAVVAETDQAHRTELLAAQLFSEQQVRSVEHTVLARVVQSVVLADRMFYLTQLLLIQAVQMDSPDFIISMVLVALVALAHTVVLDQVAHEFLLALGRAAAQLGRVRAVAEEAVLLRSLQGPEQAQELGRDL